MPKDNAPSEAWQAWSQELNSHQPAPVHCPSCSSESTQLVICCEDCFGGELVCEACTVLRHNYTPFHYTKVSLSLLFVWCIIS